MVIHSTEQDVEINGLRVCIERKPIKHIHLAVYPPDGHVHVSAPCDCADERIKLYVLEKWGWLIDKREAITKYARQNNREYVSGEAHYFKGNLYRLKIVEIRHGIQGVEIDGDYLVLRVHEGATAEQRSAVLSSWYREQLLPIIDSYISKWESILNVKLATYEIRLMAAKWGTCSKEKSKAIFNLELAKKPNVCAEYVVAHELAHLIERTHNADFLKILDRFFPDWREIKHQLNAFPV